MVDAPRTAEGWYVLHDFRSVDWDAWRELPERKREAVIEDGEHFLRHRELVADADEGDSGVFAILGHEADILMLHLRPTLNDLESIERRFEQTALAEFTEQTDSYVSVTEVSDYVSEEYFEDDAEMEAGTRRYLETKLYPDIPDDEYVSFYPMSKRRKPDQNWYELPADERSELMAEHGETGRAYGGRITQIVSSSVGLDDWEWGVTLFAGDPTDIKDIVYEMRFDLASSRYGEFGRFRVGRRFPPGDLAAYLGGETVPSGDPDAEAGSKGGAHGDEEPGSERSETTETDTSHGTDEDADADRHSADEADELRATLSDLDIYAGQPHGEDLYALVLYSEAETESLEEAVFSLRENFDHYDTHERTAIYETLADEPTAAQAEHAVVSLWTTESAADTASGFLQDLPGVVGRPDDGDGWGTMGMFYTTKSEHTEEFVDTFDDVTDVLVEMQGHRGTDLLANLEDPDDMFIASTWDNKEDALAFFRSEEFAETVSWGRDVLADRPRHVFFA
jgi:chlorite dismutase/heme-degrading monooxygenase HmoA